ncbi:MAG: citrate (Si)-synthase, eukaryotic [Flavobacteriales bacterium]|nr:citrate (Si)-synthase, eukaryotic [Flavobacteriales bacterium]|tara:strand:+ start:2554 stop:3858 length:1305 start_codon:yes stop_codon:yes gene_type:complete
MKSLKEKFKDQINDSRDRVKNLVTEYGDKIVGEISLRQIYSGMRGMLSMVTETSKLDPNEGIRFRGYSLPEIQDVLPRAKGSNQPLPEGMFYLMLIGSLPNDNDVRNISLELEIRSDVPDYVFNVINDLPKDMHPMTQFSIAILSLKNESQFTRAYKQGISKKTYWDPTFEDALNLIAKLPRIAAYIYRRSYHNEDYIEPLKGADWSQNFAHMLGFSDAEFTDLIRLYMTIHSDHEGGNVSAHTAHLVGSALSDAYLSFSAGMNGLAGPLHGLANQEVVRWLLTMQKDLGGGLPSRDKIADYVQDSLNNGKVIPGFGHAVLRKTDPRYTAQREFALKYLPDDQLFLLVSRVYEVVPPILEATGKVKNPWPNVDAHSGILLLKYGMKEYDFFTVLFGVSRSLGIMSQLIWSRALGMPIERPGSTTTDLMIKKFSH